MADEQNFSMFELGSGLPLDGARVHSVSAIFTYNQEYTANAVVLDVEWQPWDGETDHDEAQHQLYSVGQKWEPLDNGNAVGHTSGKRQKFNDQTNIGRLIKSYVEGLGDGDFDKGIQQAIQSGMDPSQADFWVGIDATLKGVTYPTQNKNPDGSVKEGRTMVIGELHGQAEAPAAAPKLAAKAGGKATKAASSAKAETNGGGDDPADHLGQALYRQLKKLAVDAADHDAFMDAAFELPDVKSDDKAWNKATERLIMASDEGSIFAEARS